MLNYGMKRILGLFLLATFVLAACGSPITDKSHEKSYDGAEKKAQREAGSDSE